MGFRRWFSVINTATFFNNILKIRLLANVSNLATHFDFFTRYMTDFDNKLQNLQNMSEKTIRATRKINEVPVIDRKTKSKTKI